MSCVEDGLDHDCSPFTFGDSVDDCQIPLIYKEDVDGPIPGAPGCNPNTTVNPAPLLEPCPLGTYGGAGTPASSILSSTYAVLSSSSASGTLIPPMSPVSYDSDSTTEATATAAATTISSSSSTLVDATSASVTAAATSTNNNEVGRLGWHTRTHWVYTIVTKYVEAPAMPTKRAIEFAA